MNFETWLFRYYAWCWFEVQSPRARVRRMRQGELAL